jgi:hypothetical protein
MYPRKNKFTAAANMVIRQIAVIKKEKKRDYAMMKKNHKKKGQ